MNELYKYKEQLIERYLRIIFKHFDVKKKDIFNELKKIVNYDGTIDDVAAYADYKPSVFNKKNKYRRYAIFTNDSFYGVDIYGKTVTCKYSDIEMLLQSKGSLFSKHKIGSVICHNGKAFSVSGTISKSLYGFIVINNIKSVEERTFDEFLINRTTKIFGEIAEWRLSDSQRWSIETSYRHQAEYHIIYRLKLVDLSLSSAYFQITIKDTDIKDTNNPDGLFEEYEWENAVNEYNSNLKIKSIFQNSILDTIGIRYDLDNIHFLVKSKTSLTTRVNNVINLGNDVADSIREANYRNMENMQRKYNKK